MLDNVEPFLKDVGNKVRALDEAKKLYGHHIAPDFFIFDYLRTDEMGVSRCIGDLLNPKGKHGQGDLFLSHFLKALDSSILTNSEYEESTENGAATIRQWDTVSTDGCKVRLEQGIDQQRRIDLYLTFKNGEIIGIENKPWASDQANQLKDYATYIEKQALNKPWLLIYLCNSEASESSIDKETRQKLSTQGKLITLNFNFLIDWLLACVAAVRAPTVRVFIEEFAKYIRKNINGDMDMSVKNEVKKIILDGNFEAAMFVSKAINDVKKELLSRLHSDLCIEVAAKGYYLEWKKSMDGAWSRYAGFGINFSSMREYDFELWFEFDSSNLNQFYWGLRRKDDAVQNINKHWDSLNTFMTSKFGKGDQTPWWPWSTYETEEGYSNWETSATPWLAIQSGELVKKIIARAEAVHEHFKDSSKLDYLKLPITL